jgi:hypothetical protein
MQTGSSGTLIGWLSGQTTFVPLWDRMEGAWLRTLQDGARYTMEGFHLVRNYKNIVQNMKLYKGQDLCKSCKKEETDQPC